MGSAPSEFGRSEGPRDPQVSAPWHRLKRWLYLSVTGETHFVALGLVHLGYVGQVFAYVVDRRTGQRSDTEVLLPLGYGLALSAKPDAGRSIYVGRAGRVIVDARDAGLSAKLDLELRTKSGMAQQLTGELQVPFGRGIGLRFDLDDARAAYTYKVADVPVDGTLTLAGALLSLGDARGALDWTRSHARRHTRWRWASACGRLKDGRRIGLNLSQHVYDDRDGVSQENTLWFDGVPRFPGALHLTPAGDDTVAGTRFRIDSADGGTALAFAPEGARRAAQSFGIVRSRFVQAHGTFTGRIAGHEVEHLYGVMEDHDALW